MIICKMPDPPNDHLQEARSSGRSFANGRSLQMIVCKRPDPPDNHLKEAGPSWWSFARGRSIRMIFCKRPVPLDDHLQEAISTGWSFARGWSLQIINCKRPDLHDDHLQEACFFLMIICKTWRQGGGGSLGPPKTWWRHLWTASDRGVRGCNWSVRGCYSGVTLEWYGVTGV